MFKCLKSDLSVLTKKVNTICKKLDKYGLSHSFEIISETVELVPAFKVVDNGRYKEQVSINPIAMEVVNYNFTMDDLKVGDYIPVAVLEHNATTDSKNLIHLIDANITIPAIWSTIPGKCEHCNSNRQRNKTVMLMDCEGNYKQVGTTCIKDFTGIDATDIIVAYADISSITLKDVSYRVIDRLPESKYIKTADYLSNCIDLINKSGYQKDNTKQDAYADTKNGKQATEAAIQKATEIIDFFAQFESLENLKVFTKTNDVSFYWNIAVSLQNEYCKMSGFIAYAAIAYGKLIEVINKNKNIEAIKAISQYQFEVGTKVEIEVEYMRSFSYETSYNGGYNTTTNYIHTFKDNQGNIFTWRTSKVIEAETDNIIKIKGSVKAHTEYKNEKQTELTRCKVG